VTKPEKEDINIQELLPTEEKIRSIRKSWVLNIKKPETKKVKKIESHNKE